MAEDKHIPIRSGSKLPPFTWDKMFDREYMGQVTSLFNALANCPQLQLSENNAQITIPTNTALGYLQIYQQGGFFYVHSPQPYAQYNLTNIFWGLDNDVLAFKWKIPNDSDHYYFFVTTNIPPTTAYQNYSLGVVLLCYETNKFYIPNDANDDLQEITFDTSLLINKNETFFFGTVTGTVITQYETGGVTSLNQKFAGFRNALTPHRTAGVYYLGGTDDTTGMIAGDFVITDDPTAPGFRFIFLCAPLADGVENDFVYTNGALKAAINPTTYVPSILDPVPTATNPWRLVSFAPSDGSILGWQTGPFDGSKSFLRRD